MSYLQKFPSGQILASWSQIIFCFQFFANVEIQFYTINGKTCTLWSLVVVIKIAKAFFCFRFHKGNFLIHLFFFLENLQNTGIKLKRMNYICIYQHGTVSCQKIHRVKYHLHEHFYMYLCRHRENSASFLKGSIDIPDKVVIVQQRPCKGILSKQWSSGIASSSRRGLGSQ